MAATMEQNNSNLYTTLILIFSFKLACNLQIIKNSLYYFGIIVVSVFYIAT